MEPASPARLYATVAGALLVVLGIVGFFYDASFVSLHDTEQALGALEVNAWFNLFYVFTGAVGVLVAGASSRWYALAMGVLFTLVGIFGLGTQWLHLTIGLLGFAAAASTPKPKRAQRQKRGSFRSLRVRKEPRNSKPRAKPARERA
ncbi:MAG: DUF4383 domain-containing protein [Solirubrobacterales bacterium]